MDKFVRWMFNAAFAVVKVPLFVVLLIAMVVSVARHAPGQPAYAHLHKDKPQAPAQP